MSPALSVVELLTQLAGAELSFWRESDLIVVAALTLPAGRQMLITERTYRDGVHILLDPTSEEIEIARDGDPWQIWNSERASYLASAVPHAWLAESWFEAAVAEKGQTDG